MSFTIRLMQDADLAAVVKIQSDAYSGHFLESGEVIAQRFAISPLTSWVAERDGQVCAYLVGYWSKVGKISPLNAPFKLIDNADCLYLHDLALFNAVQGYGLAKLLIKAAIDCVIVNSVGAIALISVQNSVDFWCKAGFAEYDYLDEEQRTNLLTYVANGAPALYMVKYL